MTYQEQIAYYSNLLALQYRNRPRAQASVQALANLAMADNVRQGIRDAFNVDPDLGPVAVGAQLDVIGKYAGVPRSVLTFSGGVLLSDADYLTLIRLKLVRNNSSAALAEIDDLLGRYLGNAVIAYDNLNMTMGYFCNSSVGSQELAQAVVALNLLPRPAGVQISSLVYGGGIENAYGWARYAASSNVGRGLLRYAGATDPATTGPWLRYTNTVTL